MVSKKRMVLLALPECLKKDMLVPYIEIEGVGYGLKFN